MLVRIGLENENQGRSVAWALDFPGVVAYGADGSEALLALPRALLNHQEWANRHAKAEWMSLDDFDMRLEETFQVYQMDAQYKRASQGTDVNAWFQDDWRPLDRVDAVRGVEQLGWSREDLLSIVQELPAEKLDAVYADETWSIRKILAHVGTTEWWLLDRLSLGGARADLPKDPLERMRATREMMNKALLDLAGREWVLGRNGELWSPRKLLRRVLWHELDHIGQIIKLL
jgi:uncharacterized damage-inducible protein DinB